MLSERKAIVVKQSSMSEKLEERAIDCALMAIEKFSIEEDIASEIK